MLQGIIQDFITVLTDLVPAFGTAIVGLFTELFLVTTEGAISGLSPVGTIAVFFLAYYFILGLLPRVMSLMRLGWSKIKARRDRRTKKA